MSEHIGKNEIVDWVGMTEMAPALSNMSDEDRLIAWETTGLPRFNLVFDAIRVRLDTESNKLAREQAFLNSVREHLDTIEVRPLFKDPGTVLPAEPFSIPFHGAVGVRYRRSEENGREYFRFRQRCLEALGGGYKNLQATYVARTLLEDFPSTKKDGSPLSELTAGEGLTILAPNLTAQDLVEARHGFRTYGPGIAEMTVNVIDRFISGVR
ncbi:MAG TPA: hypothetical protein VMR28_02095 [Candidatus Saccharimonadales bacterium]|nr:hypothetical protein [Candidatus Saccharimonadales bacterium]